MKHKTSNIKELEEVIPRTLGAYIHHLQRRQGFCTVRIKFEKYENTKQGNLKRNVLCTFFFSFYLNFVREMDFPF